MKIVKFTFIVLISFLTLGCKKEIMDKDLSTTTDAPVSLAAIGNIYYVSPTGNDSNNGTSTATPWKTIAKVNASSYVPNDQILFLGGATFNGTISINSSGASGGNFIKIASYGNGMATINGGAGAGVIETNQSYIWIDHLNFIGGWNSTTQTGNGNDGIGFFNTQTGGADLGDVFVSYCNVSGFKWSGINVYSQAPDQSQSGYATVTFTNNTVHDNGYGGIQTDGPHGTLGSQDYAFPYVYIAYNKVYNNFGISSLTNMSTGSGIRVVDASGGTIEHNVAYNNGKFNSWQGGGPIGIWGFACTKLVFQYNESYNNASASGQDGGGLDLDGGATYCTMQYNYTHGNNGAGILVWEYGNARVSNGYNIIRYNVSENDGTHGGIYAGITQGRNGSNTCNNNYYYNNTIYTNLGPALYVLTGGTKNVFFNNIFYTNNRPRTIHCDANRADIYFLNNTYYNGSRGLGIYFNGTTYSSLSSFQSATTQEQYYGLNYGYNVDPKLNSAGNGGTVGTGNPSTLTSYKLLVGSPMIDKAFNLVSNWGYNVGSKDFNGLGIPYNGAYDIGACEYRP